MEASEKYADILLLAITAKVSASNSRQMLAEAQRCMPYI
jgi:hypothetical protein